MRDPLKAASCTVDIILQLNWIVPKQNTVYGLKPWYCVSLLSVLLEWMWEHADGATSGRAMGSRVAPTLTTEQ